MIKRGDWVEIKNSTKLLEIIKADNNEVVGREIETFQENLIYGKIVTIDKRDIVEDEI